MQGPIRVAMTLEQCWHRVPGGTATAIVALARELDRRDDVSVTGITAMHRRPAVEGFAPPVPTRQIRLPRPALYESWHVLRRPVIDDADVVHGTTAAVPPRGDAPVVVTVHDLAFLRYPDHATGWGQRFFEKSVELIRTDADLVFCPSQVTADDLEAAGVGPERVAVVPWGVDWPLATADEARRMRNRFALPERFVLWVGTLEPRKNLHGLLRAYLSVEADVPLVLAGPTGWGPSYRAEIDALGERVRPLGFVSADELRPLYRAASVVVYPSWFEGFGLPVLEAMSQARPVVTSAGTSMAEVVGPTGRLIDPRDPAAIGAAIDELLADEATSRELGEAARVRADAYHWPAAAEATVAGYRRVLA